MNTTNLFVELVVIGVGALVCLLSIPLIFFGYEWLMLDRLNSPLLLIVIIGFTYVLGIISDRFSDTVCKAWDKRVRLQYFSDNEEYHRIQTFVYVNANEKISSLFEYGRSRIRIIRSWAIFFSFLGVTLSLTFLKNSDTNLPLKAWLSILIFAVFEVLFISSIIAWSKLSNNNYERLRETYGILTQAKASVQ